MRIVLASRSPRRSELFRTIGIRDFDVIPALGDEELRTDVPPYRTVELTAGAKAGEVARRCSGGDLVVAADTMVLLGSRFLGKPSDRADAARMLHALSGRTHAVLTGVALSLNGRTLLGHEETRVTFRPLTDEMIGWYLDTGEPFDKAGAYGAQGAGALLVERIDGDFFNVMGFPLVRFHKMLTEMGVSLFSCLSGDECQ